MNQHPTIIVMCETSASPLVSKGLCQRLTDEYHTCQLNLDTLVELVSSVCRVNIFDRVVFSRCSFRSVTWLFPLSLPLWLHWVLCFRIFPSRPVCLCVDDDDDQVGYVDF